MRPLPFALCTLACIGAFTIVRTLDPWAMLGISYYAALGWIAMVAIACVIGVFTA